MYDLIRGSSASWGLEGYRVPKIDFDPRKHAEDKEAFLKSIGKQKKKEKQKPVDKTAKRGGIFDALEKYPRMTQERHREKTQASALAVRAEQLVAAAPEKQVQRHPAGQDAETEVQVEKDRRRGPGHPEGGERSQGQNRQNGTNRFIRFLKGPSSTRSSQPAKRKTTRFPAPDSTSSTRRLPSTSWKMKRNKPSVSTSPKTPASRPAAPRR